MNKQKQKPTPVKNEKKYRRLLNQLYKTALLNPDGFTINISSLQFVSNGFVASYKETQNNFEIIGLKKALDFAIIIGENVLGGWYNNKNGEYYFDCSKIFITSTDAVSFGKTNQQLAIFDLSNCKEIPLS